MRATPRTLGQPGDPLGGLAEPLLQLGGDPGRELAVGAGHALAGHVLVAVVEDVGGARSPDGSLDGRELEGRPGAHRHLQVGEVGTVRLDDGAEPEVGLAASRATAVAKSSTTSMPMDEPPNRGLTM